MAAKPTIVVRRTVNIGAAVKEQNDAILRASLRIYPMLGMPPASTGVYATPVGSVLR